MNNATSNQSETSPVLTIGVIADTHIPDRVRALHPLILPIFEQAQISHILHAGDISIREVLEVLGKVAPVTAVRGNRDFFAGRLRMVEELELGGVTIVLMHGHAGLGPYLWDKLKYWTYGYQLKRYLPRLLGTGKQARVVIFGHTHHAETIWQDGKLIYNPGSASFGSKLGLPPTIGLLRIFQDGSITAETIPLRGYTVRDRNWVKVS